VKRFTLTRGSEVLAEGVVWTQGCGMIMPAEGGLPWSFANAAELGSKLNLDVSIVWIDETHEAKREPPVMVLGTMPKYTQTLIGETEHGDQVFAVEQEEKKGKLVSERLRELADEHHRCEGHGIYVISAHVELLAQVLDERLGRAP
jgi:hypothetical protein